MEGSPPSPRLPPPSPPHGFRPPRRLSDRSAGAPAIAIWTASPHGFRPPRRRTGAPAVVATKGGGPSDLEKDKEIEYRVDLFNRFPWDDYLEVEDDYVEPDEFINEDEYNEMAHITTRGPGYTGNQSFDKSCVFGNVVHLNYHQTLQLRSFVETFPRPPVEDYICTITESMEFEAQYTSNYLIKFIRPLQIVRRGPWFAIVAVKLKENSKVKYCKMFLGQDGKDKLTEGWEEIVRDFNIKEGNLCMFSFTNTREIPVRRRDSVAWLTMEILILNEDVGPEVDIGEPEEMSWR